ncbi:putative major intrinsic protein [Acrodontium crateriforme]|uniref:Major intrinsic protein n=1 Tax=Acrodontium crateriforme TaxID=150365 RepID=A0AAQ3M419_9PEZI|nr:putative major intrinsic protein [Acrodontium crateriforme]
MFIPAADPNKDLRLPLVGFLPNKVRNHFIAMMAEFVGTFMFLFLAFSATQVANASAPKTSDDSGLTQVPNVAILQYISLAFGFSLAVNAWVFFRVSGGLFNPAVTLGMAIIGAVGWMRALLVLFAQLLGSMASAAVVSALFPGPLSVSTTISNSTSLTQALFIEMFLTTLLVFTIFMLAAEKHKATFIAPIGIGLSLFVAEMSGVFFTGGSLNPARSFGPCVVNRDFPSYHWLYWLGPCLGSLIAAGFYRFCRVFEFETANPGQDFDDKEDEAFEFDEDHAATAAHVQRPVQGLSIAQILSHGPNAQVDVPEGIVLGSQPTNVGIARPQ